MAPAGEFRLVDTRLEIKGEEAIFSATLCGPTGSQPILRAWISDETETLTEQNSGPVKEGSRVAVAVRIPSELEHSREYSAVMRIESTPLCTEHIVVRKLMLPF